LVACSRRCPEPRTPLDDDDVRSGNRHVYALVGEADRAVRVSRALDAPEVARRVPSGKRRSALS